MSEVFSGNEVSDIVEGRRPVPKGARLGAEEHTVQVLTTLGNIERELRRIRSLSAEHGRQWAESDGGQASAGGIFVQRFEGPKSGNDWYVQRVTVSAGGASAAGTVALYETGASSLQAPANDIDLLDFLPALGGSTPSRAVLDGEGTPYFVYGGNGLTVVVAGVVAATPVFIRMQGLETRGGLDPALREQGPEPRTR